MQMALCSSVDSEDINLPYTKNGRTWFICRTSSEVESPFSKNSPEAGKPIELNKNGQLELYIKFHETESGIEIEKYRIAAYGIPENNNKISSIRYDYTNNIQAERKKIGWDHSISDNPQHPMSHLHINFMDENNCRLAAGQLSPILALRAFDYWYYETFVLNG